MYGRFPMSMENLPRSSGFLCFSPKYFCLMATCIYLCYAIVGLASCAATISEFPRGFPKDGEDIVTLIFVIVGSIIHGVTLILTALLVLGVLKSSMKLIRPWLLWTAFQIFTYVVLFVVSSTMEMINHFANVTIYGYMIQFIILVLQIYTLLLVASFYRDLSEDRVEQEKLRRLSQEETWYTIVSTKE